MAKTEVAKQETSTELEVISDEEQALINANQEEVDASEFVVPILKLAQPLTEEVTNGNASAGEYILGLTGDVIEPPFDFVIASKGKGRFRPSREDGERTLVAYDTPNVPWQEDPLYGTPFAEHPDAEETYSALVNEGKQDWGSGPPIQTTYNYTGYILRPADLDPDEDFPVEGIPVRLSLRRTSAPTARKLNTILDGVLRGGYWNKVFRIDSAQKKNKGTFYIVTAEAARKTTPEEKKAALELAGILRTAAVTTVGEDESAAKVADVDAEGGLDL
jgi:hypothetical protein